MGYCCHQHGWQSIGLLVTRVHFSPPVVLFYLIRSAGPPWDTTTPDTSFFSYFSVSKPNRDIGYIQDSRKFLPINSEYFQYFPMIQYPLVVFSGGDDVPKRQKWLLQGLCETSCGVVFAIADVTRPLFE